MNFEERVFADVENRIEIWFEKAVDRLDQRYMSSDMSESEYDQEMSNLKESLEIKQHLFGVLFPRTCATI